MSKFKYIISTPIPIKEQQRFLNEQGERGMELVGVVKVDLPEEHARFYFKSELVEFERTSNVSSGIGGMNLIPGV